MNLVYCGAIKKGSPDSNPAPSNVSALWPPDHWIPVSSRLTCPSSRGIKSGAEAPTLLLGCKVLDMPRKANENPNPTFGRQAYPITAEANATNMLIFFAIISFTMYGRIL